MTTVALFGASGLLLLATPASYAQDELPVVASAEASHSGYEDSTIDVHWAERSEEGGFTSVAWSVNLDKESGRFDAIYLINDIYQYEGTAVSEVTLLDEESEIRYHPLQDSEQRCLCTGSFRGPEVTYRLDGGSSGLFWTTYLLEEETSTVSLEVNGFETVSDIPVE